MIARPWRLAGLALLAIAAVVIAATFRSYGITFDDHFHDTYGKAVLRHYLSGFADREALEYFNLWLYGAAFDVFSAVLKRILPIGDFEVQHLAVACTGLAGAWAAIKIGRLVGGDRAGLFAGLALLTIPAWWGHMFINPKDIPFATAMAWALYWSLRLANELPTPRPHTVIWLGLTLGLGLGIRIAGVYAFLYPAVALALWPLRTWLREARLPSRAEIGTTALHGAVTIALAYTTMLIFWPWALRDPLRRPFEAAAVFANSPWDIRVLHRGELVSSMALPWDYLFVVLGVKLPLFILAGLAIAVFAAVRAAWRIPMRDWRVDIVLLVVAAAFPLLTFPILHPITYDGLRHFLFVLPPLAALAALGGDRLVAVADAKGRVGFAFLGVVALAIFGSPIAAMASLHPYQYTFYNALVGGTGGAQGRFELEYWGTAYREAVLKLDALVAAEGGNAPATVFVCSEGSAAAYFFSPRLKLTGDDIGADFYLATTRLDCDEEYDGDEVISVARDGAVFAVVKDRRRLRAEHPARLAHRNVAGALVAPRHPGLRRDGTRDPSLE
jgi:hypothetical protein